jgi:hypothetical protein
MPAAHAHDQHGHRGPAPGIGDPGYSPLNHPAGLERANSAMAREVAVFNLPARAGQVFGVSL